MFYATERWKKIVRKIKARAGFGESGSNETPAKKKMVQNIAIGLLNKISPVTKVSLIGLILDSYPHIIASRNKFIVLPNANDLLIALSFFRDELVTGAIFQKMLKSYPKRDSWVTAFFFSCLTFQLLSPSKAEYPPRSSSESDEDILYRHGATSTHLGLQLSNIRKVKAKFGGNGLTRLEVDVVVKNFLAAFASIMIGFWFLRGNKGSLSSRKKSYLSLALYAFFQAGHTLWTFQRVRTKSFGKPWQILTPWMNFNLKLFGRIAEIGLFSWSSYQVMLCWFYRPSLLSPSFERWITKFADIERPLLEYLRGLHKGTITEGKHSDSLAGYCRSIGLNPHLGDPYYGVPSCRIFHYLDGDNCVQAGVRRFLVASIRAFISLYFPLNLMTFVIKRDKKTEQETTEPKSILTKFKEKVFFPAARSSAFLGTFVASIFATACLLRNKFGTDRYNVVAGSAICGVSSILVESPSQRLSHTLYLLPRAVRSLYMEKFEKFIPAHFLDAPILAFSLAVLLTCFQLQPRSVQPPTRALLSWLFSKYPLY